MTDECPHTTYEDGVCAACGRRCEHELILNAACFYCGTTDLDPVALSPKKTPEVIAADRLVRDLRKK